MSERSVFAAITGRPNAGKSSLLNALVGEKIAMVSDKPQTTRTAIRGILTEGELQYVFIDTPGIHISRNKLGTHMNKAVRQAVTGIDVIVYVIDASKKLNDIDRQTLSNYGASGIPLIVLLNKTDLLEKKSDCAGLISETASVCETDSIIPISVREADGIDLVRETIASHAVEAPHYFPDDKITDQPEKVLMAEMIREKLLELMYEEVPHGIAVVIERLEERVTKKGEDIMDLDAVIYCERNSHKGMVIGKGGANLREAGTRAREELERFFGIKVDLKMWVKVREGWRNSEELIHRFGLDDV